MAKFVLLSILAIGMILSISGFSIANVAMFECGVGLIVGVLIVGGPMLIDSIVKRLKQSYKRRRAKQ